MAFDYSELAATAQELVTEFGKAVMLRRLVSAPPDPQTPWLPPVDPRAGAADRLLRHLVWPENSRVYRA